jgi:site-specific DNA recombinase
MKAIVLARVSKAGNSLPAQEHRLLTYLDKKGITVYKVYSFDESAYKKNRKEFSSIVQELLASKDDEVIVICCDKIDRLIRNFTQDLVTLEELRVKGNIELHFPSDNIVLHKDSPAADLFRFSMGVSLAKYYSDTISDNVKRAYEEKLRKGEWPGKAPYGYKNITLEDEKKDIVVEEYESKIVQKVFEWYATEAYSMDLVRQKLKTEYGLEWSKGTVDKVLKETFYFGLMEMKGKFYPHKYPPIISHVMFDKVQQVKAGHNKKKFKYAGLPYVYRGLMRCNECGCSITPEMHKGHVYYHCTQYRGKHGAEWLREEEITEQLGAIFQKMVIPRNELDRVVTSLQSIHEGKVEFREQQVKQLTREHEKYAKMTESLYLDKLQGRITESEYDKYFQSFRDKITEIDAKLAMLQEAEDTYYITAKYVLELANRAYDLFISSEVEEKRQLLKLVLLNLRLDGKTLRYEAIKPFDTIVQCHDSQVWLPGSDSNRQPTGYT